MSMSYQKSILQMTLDPNAMGAVINPIGAIWKQIGSCFHALYGEPGHVPVAFGDCNRFVGLAI